MTESSVTVADMKTRWVALENDPNMWSGGTCGEISSDVPETTHWQSWSTSLRRGHGNLIDLLSLYRERMPATSATLSIHSQYGTGKMASYSCRARSAKVPTPCSFSALLKSE